MKLIIDIPETAYEAIQAVKNIDGSNEGTLENVLIKAVEDGTPIPDNATNGNSVIKMFFKGIVRVNSRKNVSVEFNKNWWNAQYQKGSAE